MNALLKTAAAATALLLLALLPADAADRGEATAAVWQRHLESALSGDIDAVMSDFSDHSVIVTADGVLEGKAAIRAFFEAFLADSSPEVNETITVNSHTVHDRVVVFNFTIGAAARTVHDTALIEDGKIVALTTVDYPAE